jgi:hypothetical protein
MKHTALSVGRVLLAILLYPMVAVLSFWRFGDEGVTAEAVLIAALLNLAFGFGFRWLAVILAAIFFPVWYLSVDAGSCENCSVILDAGAFSLAFAVIGAAARQAVAFASRDSSLSR